MIIDATNTVMGRLATFTAKKALLGEDVDVVNCEKAIIAGSKKEIVEKYRTKMKRGTWSKGPFIHRSSEKIVKRSIRGMLPHRQNRGVVAFRKIKCHKGIPLEFADKKMEVLTTSQVQKLPNLKFITVQELSRQIGGKE